MTMLKNKRITVSLILVFLMMVSPIAKSQLDLGGLLGGLLGGGGGGGGGGLGGLFGAINILGIVRCSVNADASAPVFANAGVQLRCGQNVVSTSTTNGAGVFSMVLNPLQTLLPTLLSNCQVVVTTPLSTCNASLPSVGQLLSPLTFVGNTVNGILRIATLAPTNFGLVN
uniref:Phylloplanin n=1 Tax=Noccaea caerulescens TaxID=107243 RepID=A0A1J3FVJ0_NOCCA